VCGVVLVCRVKMPFYAVRRGENPGVYDTWGECQQQIVGFRGAQFKKFATKEEAEDFVKGKKVDVVDKRVPKEDSANGGSEGSSASDKSKKPAKKEKASEEVDYTSLPPELAAIYSQLKQQQKDLSKLRESFDAYVLQSQGKPSKSGNKRSRSSSPEQCASGGGKRRVSPADAAQVSA